MKKHSERHDSRDRIMRIRYNVDRNILIQYEDHDWNLAIPPLTGEVPNEWVDGWWLEKTEKTKCPVRPFISNLMLGFDDDDEDIYG